MARHFASFDDGHEPTFIGVKLRPALIPSGTDRPACPAHPARRRLPLAPWTRQAPLALLASLASLLVMAGPAAATLPAGAAAQAETLARQAASALAPAGARVLATAGAPDPRWRLAPCTRVQAQQAGGSPPWGPTRVQLRCMQGARWSVFLPVQVQVLAPAWVARGPLPTGTTLDASLLVQAETDWAAAGDAPLADMQALTGRKLAQPLAAGQAPRQADLQRRRWFRSGQTVQVVLVGTNFAVAAEAEAVSDGFEGSEARVRTPAGRLLTGRAVGERRLEVSL